MLTSRGRTMLMIGVLALSAGLLTGTEGVALAGLLLLVWFMVEWFRFRWAVAGMGRAFSELRREIQGQPQHRISTSLDAEKEIRMMIRVRGGWSGMRFWLEDLVPSGIDVIEGSPACVADPRQRQRISWTYRIRPAITGQLVFAGCQFVLADAQGLFRARRFQRAEQILMVFPFMVRPRSTVSVLKTNNVQWITGHHRHRRPGYSAELLGIRDYLTGDPPRSIAWKPTARLGKLMTCEYESEVPFRATVICDLSPYHYAGRPQVAVADRIVSVAASIARLLLSDRDPVGCLVLSESRRLRIPHALGERHMVRILQSLVTAPRLHARTDAIETSELIRQTWSSVQRMYPELLDNNINPRRISWFEPGSARGTGLGSLALSIIRGSAVMMALRALTRLGGGRPTLAQRQQLAFALTALSGESAGQSLRLFYDDQLLRRACADFHELHPEFQIESLFEAESEERPEALRRSIQSICGGLMEGVAHASDNELFVIVGSAPFDTGGFEELERAIKVARGSHHRVIMIDCALEAFEGPTADATAARIIRETRDRSSRRRSSELQRRLGRYGAKTARLEDPLLIEGVAMEVDLLKQGRGRVNSGVRF